MHLKYAGLSAGLVCLASCAATPDSIQPAYVSAVPYESWSCQQLGDEELRLESALATASKQQLNARSSDTLGVLLIGLPVSSLSGGNVAPQIAEYKGQITAVQQASSRKLCGSPANPS